MDLETLGPSDHSVQNVQCNGDENIVAECNTTSSLSQCETSAGVVCQGNNYYSDNFCVIDIFIVTHTSVLCIPILPNTFFFVLDPLTTSEDNCTDGNIRLTSNSSNPLKGRLEICYNHAWGTVCDTGFSQNDADVVCRQLGEQFGYAHSHSIPLLDAAFGEGVGPIFIDNLGCGGNEIMISDCNVIGVIGLAQCDHSNDAGVECIGRSFLTKLDNQSICT